MRILCIRFGYNVSGKFQHYFVVLRLRTICYHINSFNLFIAFVIWIKCGFNCSPFHRVSLAHLRFATAVQPHDALVLRIIKSLLPIFLNVKIWVITSPSFIVSKLKVVSSNSILGGFCSCSSVNFSLIIAETWIRCW